MTAPSLLLRVDTYRPGLRQRPHAHGEMHFSLILAGRVSEEVGSTTEYGGPMSVVVKDAGVVHANAFAPGITRIARLTLAGGTIASLVDDSKRAESWRWTHDARIARPFLRLVKRAKTHRIDVTRDDADLVDLLAVFTARKVAADQGTPPRWLSETIDAMRAEWKPGTTVADISRKANVHPVYLARCVRRWYGHGIAEELRRVRLTAASAAIADGKQTISVVAHATGFSDEAHLCREFSRTTGVAPGAYRSLLQSLQEGCENSRRRAAGE